MLEQEPTPMDCLPIRTTLTALTLATAALAAPATACELSKPGTNCSSGGLVTTYLNVTAARDVTITGFHLQGRDAGAPITMNLYWRTGTYAGHLDSAAGWTFLETISGNVGDDYQRTVLLRNQVSIAAGQTIAFAYEYEEGFYRGSDNTTTSASNGDLSIFSDAVGSVNFDGYLGACSWAGSVHYMRDFDADDSGDRGGRAVANCGDVNGDGADDFIVGAPMASHNGTASGSVFVYSGADGSLLHTRHGWSAGDRFGWSVAGLGDVNGDGFDDFAIGAPRWNNRRGRVYVIAGGSFSQLYKRNGQRSGDDFGYAVGGDADVDGDGRPDFIVGAPNNDDAGSKAGAAYVYSGRTGARMLTKHGERAGDRFGWSVAGVGRCDGDAFGEFIVGAPWYDRSSSKPNTGRAYVFSGPDGDRLYRQTGTDPDEQMGRTVTGVRDVNDDGRDDWAIGAPFFDKGSRIDAGRVKVHSGRTGRQLWSRSGAASGDRYGWAISWARDLNNDGFDDVLIGAPQHDFGGEGSGRVYLRSGPDGASVGRVINGQPGAQFGHGLACIGDADNDGTVDLIVGAPDFGTGKGAMICRDTSDPFFATWEGGDDEPLLDDDGRADLQGHGVDPADLAGLLSVWGNCPGCAWDLDGDDDVDGDDLGRLLHGEG